MTMILTLHFYKYLTLCGTKAVCVSMKPETLFGNKAARSCCNVFISIGMTNCLHLCPNKINC